jgi:hypothetical protein
MEEAEKNPYKGVSGAPKLRPSVAAFLDILGYSNYIETVFKEDGKGEKELARLRSALDGALAFLKQGSQNQNFVGKLDFQVRSFTDNLLIGYPIPEHRAALGILSSVISYIG